VLRMRANEVELPDAWLPILVERMTNLMHEAHGVGLAGPQVGILRRVLVYQVAEENPAVALVNPRVASSSEERVIEAEGCLSLGAASVIVPVERAQSVTVDAFSPEGEPLEIEAEGLEARVIQHEIDHLDGVLIIDRTTPEARREALGKLRPQPVLAPFA
ncbi:MAG: peptide deformylase, partial [Candidatus Limnocylindria bacterium]